MITCPCWLHNKSFHHPRFSLALSTILLLRWGSLQMHQLNRMGQQPLQVWLLSRHFPPGFLRSYSISFMVSGQRPLLIFDCIKCIFRILSSNEQNVYCVIYNTVEKKTKLQIFHYASRNMIRSKLFVTQENNKKISYKRTIKPC